MRFFALLLALLFTFQPLFAQTKLHRLQNLRSAPSGTLLRLPRVSPEELERRRQEEAARAAQEQARKKWENALKQLAERQNPLNWKEISWKEFLKQNKHSKEVELVSTHLDIICTENLCKLLPDSILLEDIITTGNSEVDYKPLLANHKIIYVGEGMNHDTKAAPLETVKILRATREANPNAKILLAAEFLVWREEDNLAEIKRWLDYYRRHSYTQELRELQAEIKKPASLLKKAGEKSDLYFSEEYAPVFQAADELGIDQLALDDNIFGVSRTNEVAAKTGEFIVWVQPQDKIPHWASIKKSKMDYFNKRYAALEQNIGVSPWGVRERNREWARRIKILQPFYDVIIVYAGDGHVDNTYYIDLQPMVEQKDFLNIILYPLEDLPAEIHNYYKERSDATEKNRITQDALIWEEQQKLNTDNFKSSNQDWWTWKDLSKPFWALQTDEKGKDIEVLLNESQKQAWEKEEADQKEFRPFIGKARLEVYLPAQ